VGPPDPCSIRESWTRANIDALSFFLKILAPMALKIHYLSNLSAANSDHGKNMKKMCHPFFIRIFAKETRVSENKFPSLIQYCRATPRKHSLDHAR
jgi:hypothetical protein